MNTIGHFINGQLSTEASRTQKVFNPATGESNSEVAIASQKTVLEAIVAAENAFPAWRDTPVIKRARVMFKF